MDIKIFGSKLQIRIEYVIIGAVLLSCAAVIIGYKLATKDKGIIIEAGSDTQEEINSNGQNNDQVNGKKDEIKVYVVGCVNKPGVVTINRGQIIEDAVNAAGGATENADIENINMAFVLNYNLMLRIYGKDEIHDPGGSNTGNGADIIQNSGGALEVSAVESGKININSATVQELDTLPGIGEATAADIVIYREQHGAFNKIEDIMNVSGIKEAKFEAVKDFIIVD